MRILAVVKRIIRQLLRDKRTLALLFLAPLLVLTLMYLFFGGETASPDLGTVGIDGPLVEKLEEQDVNIIPFEEGGRGTVVENDLDGLLKLEDGRLQLILQNDDPNVARSLYAGISQAAMSQNSGGPPVSSEMEAEYIYGNEDTVFFDVLSPMLIGFFVFFFVFLISGIGLLKERTTGTLERLMATPIRKGELIAAYLAGFGLFAIIQTIIVVAFSILVLDVVLVGSVWHVLLINVLLALVALSLGILLSTFAASEFQMVQFIPVVVVPQIFFSGIFPVDRMADWLQDFGRVMPLYYAADALKAVMYQGQGIEAIKWDLFALLVFAAIFIILNIFALKRHRA